MIWTVTTEHSMRRDLVGEPDQFYLEVACNQAGKTLADGKGWEIIWLGELTGEALVVMLKRVISLIEAQEK